MPIPKPSSLLNLLNRFEGHWEAVNALVAPLSPLTVLEELPIAVVDELRTRLLAAEAALKRLDVESRLALEEAQVVKRRLLAMVREFNAFMRAFYPGTVLGRLVSKVRMATESAQAFHPMVWETEFVWEKLEALPPELQWQPPVLRDGTTLALFLEKFAELRATQGVWEEVGFAMRLARVEMEVVREEVLAVAVAYRHAVLGRLRPGTRLRASVPELWHRGEVRKAKQPPGAQ